MSEHSHHLSSDLGHEDQFEREMRGYNRRAVDEYVAALRIDVRSLEDGKRDMEVRLSQALDDVEQLKLELSTARSVGKPPHEEISERIGQILKLADDEAASQRNKANEEITKLRTDAQAETSKLRADAKAETDRTRAEAHEQAERMLSAAQEQAENTVNSAKAEAENAIASAKGEAEKTRKTANTEAQRVVADATKQAETAVANAKAQAKQQLDEATARATAIHDGAERRLNLLTSRHTETILRLTEVRDLVTGLVAGEAERGSLEDEVSRSVASAMSGSAGPQGAAATAEGRHASAAAQPNGQPGASPAAGQAAVGPAAAGPAAAGPAAPGHAAGQPQPSRAAQPVLRPPAGHIASHPGGAGPAIPGQRTQSSGGNGQPVVGQGQQPRSGNGQQQDAPPRQPSAGTSPLDGPADAPRHASGGTRRGLDNDDTAEGLRIIRD
jgi:cell division septum initiation protein DivIVA